MNLKRLFKKPERKSPLIINQYNTAYQKNVLISYLTDPFKNPNHFKHQNYMTSHIVAESFFDLGYNVDVVDYTDRDTLIDYSKYHVFFGFGYPFERSFYQENRKIPRIHFITGAHNDFHNMMGLKSANDFYKLSGVWLPAEANILSVTDYYAMYDSDITIILARGYIFEDCKSRFNNQIYSLNNNILGVFANVEPKIIAGRTNHFLFLSGGKQITKGLYIVLEVARLRKDLNFHVVVPYITEAFTNHYGDLFGPEGNVSLHIDIRMDSEEMKQVIKTCTYSLAPSYVDGLPGGTIEPMAAGLIPIVSRYCGFPSEDFIFELEDLLPETLNQMLSRVLALSDEDYLNCSEKVSAYALNSYSAPTVKKDLTDILSTELGDALNNSDEK